MQPEFRFASLFSKQVSSRNPILEETHSIELLTAFKDAIFEEDPDGVIQIDKPTPQNHRFKKLITVSADVFASRVASNDQTTRHILIQEILPELVRAGIGIIVSAPQPSSIEPLMITAGDLVNLLLNGDILDRSLDDWLQDGEVFGPIGGHYNIIADMPAALMPVEQAMFLRDNLEDIAPRCKGPCLIQTQDRKHTIAFFVPDDILESSSYLNYCQALRWYFPRTYAVAFLPISNLPDSYAIQNRTTESV